MKKTLTLIVMLLFYLNLASQELKLISIEEKSIDTLLSTNNKYDLNGNLSAVVVLSFQEPINGLSFRGSVIEYSVSDEYTYILYIADITKRITIQHEKYYPFVLDFRDNGIKIKSGHSYLAKIDNKISFLETETADMQDAGSQYLVFKSEKRVKRIAVDGEEWLLNDNWHYYESYPDIAASKLVPFGTYHYEAESIDGKIIKGEVKVKSKISSKVVNLMF